MSEHGRGHGQRGFALVLALGAIAVVLAMAAALDAWVASRVEQARLIRERVQDDLDAYSTRATLLYLLGTQRYTRAGLTSGEPADRGPLQQDEADASELRIDPVGGEIALDGTPYRGLGRIRFALQDQSGLVALNSDSQVQLRTLLQTFPGDETRMSVLLDTLADYRDANAMKRLNGAEQEEYEAAGLPPPTNYHLRSVPELLRVLGWREWLAEQPEFRMHEWLSTGRVEMFNPNVVPADLLGRVSGLTPEQAARILAQRTEDPFRSVPDFNDRTDVELPVDDELYRFFPSDSLQIRIWREGAAQAELLALQLTPLGRQGPWQIGSTYRITRARDDEAHETPGDYFGTGTPAAR